MPKVSLFITCLVDSLYPDAGEATVRLLNRYGYEVDFPEGQTCCGQPSFNSGYFDETREVAKTLLNAFEDSEIVVGPSGSCVGMIKHNYPELFKDDPLLLRKAKELGDKIYELTQFLVHVVGLERIHAYYPARVTYHANCHAQRLLGVRDEPIQLIHRVIGAEYVEIPYMEECCGFGGLFSVKMPEISTAMVREKAKNVAATEAEILLSSDLGCLMNISGRLSREGKKVKAMHLAQFLYEGVKRYDERARGELKSASL